MGVQDRDWYREALRKRSGYTERARFRRSQTELNREAAARPFRRIVGAFILAIIASMLYRVFTW